MIYLNATLPSRSAHWYSVMAHEGPTKGFAPYVDHPEEYQVFLSAKANQSESIQVAIDYAAGLNYNAAQERHGYWVSSMPRVRDNQGPVCGSARALMFDIAGGLCSSWELHV